MCLRPKSLTLAMPLHWLCIIIYHIYGKLRNLRTTDKFEWLLNSRIHCQYDKWDIHKMILLSDNLTGCRIWLWLSVTGDCLLTGAGQCMELPSLLRSSYVLHGWHHSTCWNSVNHFSAFIVSFICNQYIHICLQINISRLTRFSE